VDQAQRRLIFREALDADATSWSEPVVVDGRDDPAQPASWDSGGGEVQLLDFAGQPALIYAVFPATGAFDATPATQLRCAVRLP
jgi:hypothetical protein